MTKDQKKLETKQERLAKALRENLKKRKVQARKQGTKKQENTS